MMTRWQRFGLVIVASVFSLLVLVPFAGPFFFLLAASTWVEVLSDPRDNPYVPPFGSAPPAPPVLAPPVVASKGTLGYRFGRWVGAKLASRAGAKNNV